MDEVAYHFENSFLTLNIDKEDVMVSSFPNKVVLGEPFVCGYKKSRSFYFCLHEIKDLFYALSSAIEYITFEKDEPKGVILQRTLQESYQWEGLEITHVKDNGDIRQERKFKISKEQGDSEKYEILLTFHQTEIIIKIINDLVLSAMCLKFSDRKLIEKFIEKKLCPNFDNKYHLTMLMMKEKEKENIAARVDVMFFYRDILQLLVESNDLRIKLIHPQFFVEGLNVVTSNAN